MTIERTAAPAAPPLPELSPLDLTCIRQGLSPEILDMMADTYRRSAENLRAYRIGRDGWA